MKKNIKTAVEIKMSANHNVNFLKHDTKQHKTTLKMPTTKSRAI